MVAAVSRMAPAATAAQPSLTINTVWGCGSWGWGWGCGVGVEVEVEVEVEVGVGVRTRVTLGARVGAKV